MFMKLSDRDAFGRLKKYRSAKDAGLLWSPLDLNPLVLFDASAISGNNNDPLAIWNDLSVNGHNATQSTESKKFLLKTGLSGINGHNSIFADGSDDTMSVPISGMSSIREMTWAIVYKSDNVSTTRRVFSIIGGAGAWVEATAALAISNINSSLDNNTNTNIIIADFKENSDYNVWQNNVSKGAGALGSLSFWSASGFNISGDRNPSPTQFFFEGKVAYLAMFPTQLSTKDRTRVYSFLTARYIP